MAALFALRSSIRSAIATLQAFERLCAVLSHAVSEATSARLDRPAKRFHVLPACAPKKAWLGQNVIGEKRHDGNRKSGPKDHNGVSGWL